MQVQSFALGLTLLTVGCTGTTLAHRRNVSFTYTSDIRDYEGSAYHITCEYDHTSRDLVIQLNHDGSEALKMLRYQWNTEQASQQDNAGRSAGGMTSVDESYHFKNNGSKRVTLSGVPPYTRVSIGLVPNPEHEQGGKYWIYIGSTCWTGSKIGKPSKVHILPTSAFTHPLVEWSAPLSPNGPIDGYDFSWCVMPTEEKVKRSTRDVSLTQKSKNSNSSSVSIASEQGQSIGQHNAQYQSGQNGQGSHSRRTQSGQGGQSSKAGLRQGTIKGNNSHSGNTHNQSPSLNERAVLTRGQGQQVSQSPHNSSQGKTDKVSALNIDNNSGGMKTTIISTVSSTVTTATRALPPPPTTTTPKPEAKCATKDIPVNPANVDVFKGYKAVIEDYDPTATYRVCIRAYNWKGTDKVHSDEECHMRSERAHFEREYFEMCPQ